MVSRLALRPLLVCSAFFAICQVAPAQTKVGVINLQRAVFESAEIKKADAQMTATFRPQPTACALTSRADAVHVVEFAR